MKIKRKTMVILLTTICILNIVACGKTKKETGDDINQKEEELENPDFNGVDEQSNTNSEDNSLVDIYPRVAYEDYSNEFKNEDEAIILYVSENVPVVQIPENEEAENKINQIFEKKHKEFASEIEETKTSAEGAYNQQLEEEKDLFQPFGMGNTYKELYVSDKMICLEELSYEMSGGAHPNTFVKSYVFDVTTGNRLTLNDIVTDPDQAMQIAETQFKRIASEQYEKYGLIDGYEESLMDIYRDDMFYLNKDGITFICNAYIIAQFEAGRMDFTIPYSEFPVLKEEYKP